MFKAIIVGASILAVGAVGLTSVLAETRGLLAQNSGEDKTSDRTPGNKTPDRSQGASRSGAAGTDAGQTEEGTSDRTPSNHPATTDAKGAERGNLFTEKQARTHLAQQGYTNISELMKDESGIWRGTAMKDGNTIMVGVDIRGNVSTN
ncbi:MULTISPECIES: hypothetical protein [Filomicrobium]|uniref:PepSY domain-containing protein n=1 Tax=Filomicrobium insigne TaxID=418854 RepID=A0A1H0SH11_9HYPH|nr:MULTISPECIES: hypothetical protein [Filomicrobium]MCV0371062.1 hypothetical protein [Filomicrobium sp.]SDP41034.1 hypothetical protein SAMN04488061_2894 [Filomicrobium insigne]